MNDRREAVGELVDDLQRGVGDAVESVSEALEDALEAETERGWAAGWDADSKALKRDGMSAIEMLQQFHDNYGSDNQAALHAAYDLICYLEQTEVIGKVTA